MEGGLPESSSLFKNPIPATRAMLSGAGFQPQTLSREAGRSGMQDACLTSASPCCSNVRPTISFVKALPEKAVFPDDERGPGLKSNQRIR